MVVSWGLTSFICLLLFFTMFLVEQHAWTWTVFLKNLTNIINLAWVFQFQVRNPRINSYFSQCLTKHLITFYFNGKKLIFSFKFWQGIWLLYQGGNYLSKYALLKIMCSSTLSVSQKGLKYIISVTSFPDYSLKPLLQISWKNKIQKPMKMATEDDKNIWKSMMLCLW